MNNESAEYMHIEETMPQICASDDDTVAPETIEFYRQAIHTAKQSEVEFLIGGAYAFRCYTGIVRNTKDLDFFIRHTDLDRFLRQFLANGFLVEITEPQWLAKARKGDLFVDVIYGSMSEVTKVDDRWFERSNRRTILGHVVDICPVEEMIWSKAFVLERDRFDGADISHLLLKCSDEIDWDYLIERFGPNWQMLLMHVVLFRFVYPSRTNLIPDRVIRTLVDRFASESAHNHDRGVCRGTLVAPSQYKIDVQQWGFKDARFE